MAFSFDDLREKVTDLAQSGVAKSKQLAEIAKLKTSNMGEEDTIKKAYLEIGKLYYAERGMAPDGAYMALCEKITAAKTNIEANNARIAELREKPDVVDVDFADVEEEAEAPAAEPAAPEYEEAAENTQPGADAEEPKE